MFSIGCGVAVGASGYNCGLPGHIAVPNTLGCLYTMAMVEFLGATWNVLLALSPWLLLGAAIAGILHVLLPENFLERHFSGTWGVLKSVVLGVPLPLCSCGVIPVAVSLKKGGGSDGATVAFLISTPQTGVDSVLVSASLLGWPFALFKVASAAVTGLIGGWLTDATGAPRQYVKPTSEPKPRRSRSRFLALLDHSIEMLHSIWRWLLVGVLASAAIDTFLPEDTFAGLAAYGGLAAMLITLLIALPLYVCATASVPIAAALVARGLPVGAALVFLMAGPATNIATLGAVYRTLGRRPLAIYLATVVIGSIACGWAFGFVLDSSAANSFHEHTTPNWWSVTSAIALVALLGGFAILDTKRLINRSRRKKPLGHPPTFKIAVSGMKCNACVARLEKILNSDAGIESAIVALEPGSAEICGDASAAHVRSLIEAAGFCCPE